MLIVYRKNNKEILFNSGKSFIEPQGMSDVNGKLAVIEQIGGAFEDYGTYRLHDVEDKEKVDEILQYQSYVSLVFEDDEAVDYVIDYEKYDADQLALEEQRILDSVKPSEKEIKQAEIKLVSTELLMEVGLI